ncbi:MAG: SagB family peptide dehydrogenase, partial [Sulfolobaceae archaeon]
VELPTPDKNLFKLIDFGEILKKRESTRRFSNESISLQTLSTLLYYSAGVKHYVNAYGYTKFPLRMFPSAGGLSEVEIYIVPLNIDGLTKFNVYHYNPLYNRLYLINKEENPIKNAVDSCVSSLPPVFTNEYPALTIFLTSNFGKIIQKYGSRGARFAIIDIGIIVENFYLVSTELDLGIVAIGGCDDNLIENALNINIERDLEAPIIGLLIGGREKK